MRARSKRRRPNWKWLGATLLGLLSLIGCRPPATTPPAGPSSSSPVTTVTEPSSDSSSPSPEPTPSNLPQIRFRDVSRELGIDFKHSNAASGARYFPEIMGAGGLFFDYDGDGDQDIFLVNGARLPGLNREEPLLSALYRNDGDAGFTNVTDTAGLAVEFYGMGAVAADYDNDGDADLFVTAVLGPSRLFRNNGEGIFTEVTQEAGVDNQEAWGTSAAWVDYDRDNWLDLFVGSYVHYYSLDDDLPFFHSNIRTYATPFAYQGDTCRLYRNRGNGTFEDVTAASGIQTTNAKALGVVAWDYDEDGWPDLFVANDKEAAYYFHNQGDGTFVNRANEVGIALGEMGEARAGMGIDLAHEQNDERVTLTISTFSGETYTLARAQSGGFFRDEAVQAGVGEGTFLPLGFGACFVDVANNGWQDLVYINGHVMDNISSIQDNSPFAQLPLLYWNQRDGSYREVGQNAGEPFQEAIVGRGLAWGDYDDDGRLDLLVTENNGPARLWRNETPAAQQDHWLKLILTGTKSNRDGIGARITVKAGDLIQKTQVKAGHSYLCQSDLRPHFGLGAATRVDEIEIHWPSQVTDRWRDVAVDQILTLREGTGDR